MSKIMQVEEFLKNEKVRTLLSKFSEKERVRNDIGFNLFHVISHLYYRENLHSDIIYYFLNSGEKHREGDKFLNYFIDFLSRRFNNKINLDTFKYVKVSRELGKIDILIEGDRYAIVLENKMNNAPDMPNQLPKYNEYVKRNFKKDVLCFIYLTLTGNSGPDYNTWTVAGNDARLIKDRIFKLAAFDDTDSDLLNGWIRPCIEGTRSEDVRSFLKQYSKIIQNLSKSSMDKELMREFTQVLSSDGNHDSAILIRNMLNYLPQYLAGEIHKKYESNFEPFKKPVWYRSTLWLDNCEIDKFTFKIRVDCTEIEYTVNFLEHHGNVSATQHLLERIGFIDEGKFYEQEFVKKIPFNEKPIMFKYIDDLINALNRFIASGERLSIEAT